MELSKDMDKKYNKLILITAPSGAGKTSIVKYLMTASFRNWHFQFLQQQEKPATMKRMEKIIILFLKMNSEKKFIIRNFLNGKWYMKENIMVL